jgi:hypothetical protein
MNDGTDGEGLLRELRDGQGDNDRVLFARLLREASGTSAGDWVMSEQDSRDAAHVLGLVRLVAAARARLFAYVDLPARSRERSAILLRGAARLSIATEWKGWP